MKTNLLFLPVGLVLAAIFLQSCASHGPAFSGNTGSYMAKPVYDDSPAGAIYFSGRYNNGYVYYDSEKNNAFELASHVSFIRRHFYFSGGLFTYFGTYKADTSGTATRLRSYSFNGFGTRLELGTRIPINDKFELLPGFGTEFFGEGGEYTELTEDVESIFGEAAFLGIDGVGAGLHLDFRYVPSAARCFGLRYSYEAVSDNEGRTEDLSFQRLTLHAALDRVTAFGQIGFANSGRQTFSLGLTYAIPFSQKG